MVYDGTGEEKENQCMLNSAKLINWPVRKFPRHSKDKVLKAGKWKSQSPRNFVIIIETL